jgi:hypothetical protein
VAFNALLSVMSIEGAYLITPSMLQNQIGMLFANSHGISIGMLRIFAGDRE